MNSRYLFSAIVTSIGEVARENVQTPQKKKKSLAQTSSKAFNRKPGTKFGKRFNLGGSGMTQAAPTATESKKEVRSMA